MTGPKLREFWVRPPSDRAVFGACATEEVLGGIHVVDKASYDQLQKENQELRDRAQQAVAHAVRVDKEIKKLRDRGEK